MDLNIPACRHALGRNKLQMQTVFDFSNAEDVLLLKGATPGRTEQSPRIVVVGLPESIPTWLLMHRSFR